MVIPLHEGSTSRFHLVVGAASLGGMDAVSLVLAGLPASFPVPIALAHHRGQGTDDEMYAMLLRRRTDLPVRVMAAGDPVLEPGVTLVPAAFHAAVEPTMRWALEQDPAGLMGTSGDRLFASAAATLGAALLAVVFTGRLRDGSRGVRAVKAAGGRVLVEDPASARAPDMPRNAISTGCVDHVVATSRIAAALVALALAPGGAELLAVSTPPWASLAP